MNKAASASAFGSLQLGPPAAGQCWAGVPIWVQELDGFTKEGSLSCQLLLQLRGLELGSWSSAYPLKGLTVGV